MSNKINWDHPKVQKILLDRSYKCEKDRVDDISNILGRKIKFSTISHMRTRRGIQIGPTRQNWNQPEVHAIIWDRNPLVTNTQRAEKLTKFFGSPVSIRSMHRYRNKVDTALINAGIDPKSDETLEILRECPALTFEEVPKEETDDATAAEDVDNDDADASMMGDESSAFIESQEFPELKFEEQKVGSKKKPGPMKKSNPDHFGPTSSRIAQDRDLFLLRKRILQVQLEGGRLDNEQKRVKLRCLRMDEYEKKLDLYRKELELGMDEHRYDLRDVDDHDTGT